MTRLIQVVLIVAIAVAYLLVVTRGNVVESLAGTIASPSNSPVVSGLPAQTQPK